MYEYIGEIEFGEKKKKSSELLVTNSSRISFQTQHFKISMQLFKLPHNIM